MAAVMGDVDPRAAESERSATDALRTCGPQGATSGEWMDRSGLPKTTFHDARKRLVASGRVLQEGRRYRLAETETRSETGPEEVREIEPKEDSRKVGPVTPPFRGYRPSGLGATCRFSHNHCQYTWSSCQCGRRASADCCGPSTSIHK